MSDSLVLGNGNILAGLDHKGQLKDFYYHHIGMENHVGYGCKHRFGIYVDGVFTWIEDSDWDLKIGYKKNSLVSHIEALNKHLGLNVTFTDTVDWKKDAFIRRISINNLHPMHREIKIYFHQQFKINGTSKRDTGYYDPTRNLIIHYEGRRVFAINAKFDEKYFDDYTVGNYGIDGKEGSWRDAEDGQLQKCAIEHGPVDSVISISGNLPPFGTVEGFYWLAAGRCFKEAIDLGDHIKKHNPNKYLKTTEMYWQNWLKKYNLPENDLEDDIIDFYRNSLLILRTHVGNSGEIIASGDSDMYQYGKDTYAYVWPRDAAYIVMALLSSGHASLAKNFFEFAREALDDEGYFYHKYLCDRSVGSSWHPWIADGKIRKAIQEDETAIVLCALKDYYEKTMDMEYAESLYASLIKKSADFMCRYRDIKTGLPLPSYDLWEQDYAIHAYTAATVCGGLSAAAEFAMLFGKNSDYRKYAKAAKEIKVAIRKYFYNKDKKFFYQSLDLDGEKITGRDRIDISSFFGIFFYKILNPNDEQMRGAYLTLCDKLSNKTQVGGTARYEYDEFHRVSGEAPANPWFITTFWKTQYDIACAKTLEELKKNKEVFHWAIKHSTSAGMLSEQIGADNGEQISASPLAWSHAEYISLVHCYAEKYKELNKK